MLCIPPVNSNPLGRLPHLSGGLSEAGTRKVCQGPFYSSSFSFVTSWVGSVSWSRQTPKRSARLGLASDSLWGRKKVFSKECTDCRKQAYGRTSRKEAQGACVESLSV